MIISYRGQRYSIGVTFYNDYINNRNYDRVFYIDEQKVETFRDFLEKASLGNSLLWAIDNTIEIWEINEGNPNHYILLTEVAARKKPFELWREINTNRKEESSEAVKTKTGISNYVSYLDYYKYINASKKNPPHARKPSDGNGNVVDENASSNFLIREIIIRVLNIALAILLFIMFYKDANTQKIKEIGLSFFSVCFLLAYFGFRLIMPVINAFFVKQIKFKKCISDHQHCETCNNTKPDKKTFYLYLINKYLDDPFIYCPSCSRIYRFYPPQKEKRLLAIVPFIPLISMVIGGFIWYKLDSNLIVALIAYLVIQLLPFAFLVSASRAWNEGHSR